MNTKFNKKFNTKHKTGQTPDKKRKIRPIINLKEILFRAREQEKTNSKNLKTLRKIEISKIGKTHRSTFDGIILDVTRMITEI